VFSNRTDSLKRAAALNACRLIIVSIYFWSGIQKLNPAFVRGTFPWMLAPFTGVLSATVIARVHSLAVAAPFVEIGIALGLLTQRLRNAVVFVAVAMHLFILASVGPLGLDYNNVIWPCPKARPGLVRNRPDIEPDEFTGIPSSRSRSIPAMEAGPPREQP
jgi:hypothetical protein